MSIIRILLALTLAASACVTKPAAEQIRLIEEEARLNRTLDQAEAMFEKGEFEKSNATLTEILGKDTTMATAYRTRLYLLKARLATAFAQPNDVRYWLTKLFEVAPEAQLDPLKDPPTTLAMWQEVKQTR